MRRRKRYTISVDRQQIIAGHHVIVISDGKHEDITFELTVKGSNKVSVILNPDTEAIAKVAIYDKTDRSYLEQKGEVDCSLYQLAETAAGILQKDKHYHLLNNNCQIFCNRFLAAYGLPTYATDADIVQKAGEVASKAYSYFSGSFQQK